MVIANQIMIICNDNFEFSSWVTVQKYFLKVQLLEWCNFYEKNPNKLRMSVIIILYKIYQSHLIL